MLLSISNKSSSIPSFVSRLRGTVRLGAAEFNLKADLPVHEGAALSGANSSPLSFKHAISDLVELTDFSPQLPGDFPDLFFEEDTLRITVSPGGALLSGTAAGEWKNPFGVLKGLTLRNFQLNYSSANRTLGLAVDAEFGSARPKGRLLFDRGKLRIVAVTLDEISLGSILAKSLGIVWGPLNALILRVSDPAEPIRFYYCDGPAYAGYEEGFRVDQAAIEIAGHRAEVALSAAGGTATLAGRFLSDIDLGFLRLSAADESRMGPALSVDEAERALRLDAGITFLGERLGTSTVAARPPSANGYELRGEIRATTDVLVFKTPDFIFTWSKAKGFHVDTWAMPDFPFDLSFVELLNKVPMRSACGPFSSEMVKQSIHTRFDLKARIDSGPESALRFTLNGRYRIFVDQDEVVSGQLPPNLTLLLKPDEFNFTALANGIRDAIHGSATALVQQLVDPTFPERSTQFLGALLVQPLPEEVANLIRCRGWSVAGPVPTSGPDPAASATSEREGEATPDRYARELRRRGMTAQQAASLIAGVYPALGPADLISLLRRHYPETVGTPLLMLWALDRAGVPRESAAQAFLTRTPDVKDAAFSAAVKTVDPHPRVEQTVKHLQRLQTSGLQAARQLKAAFPTFSATQIGYLLLVHFSQTVPDARAMGTALRGMGANYRQVRTAIYDLFPVLSPAEVEAVARSCFQGGP